MSRHPDCATDSPALSTRCLGRDLALPVPLLSFGVAVDTRRLGARRQRRSCAKTAVRLQVCVSAILAIWTRIQTMAAACSISADIR